MNNIVKYYAYAIVFTHSDNHKSDLWDIYSVFRANIIMADVISVTIHSCPNHSTTTAIMKITDDILHTMDKSNLSILTLVDLSKTLTYET